MSKRRLDKKSEPSPKKTKSCSECAKLDSKFLSPEGHFDTLLAKRYRLLLDEERISLGIKLYSGSYTLLTKTEEKECGWKIISDRSNVKDFKEVFLIESKNDPPLQTTLFKDEWLWLLGRFFPGNTLVLANAIAWAFGSFENVERIFKALFHLFVEKSSIKCWILFNASTPIACYLLFGSDQYRASEAKSSYRLYAVTFAQERYCMESTPNCRGRIISENELLKKHGCHFWDESWKSPNTDFSFIGITLPITDSLFYPSLFHNDEKMINSGKISLFLELLSSAIHLEVFQVNQKTHLNYHKRVVSGQDGTDLIPKNNTDPLPTLMRCDLEALFDTAEWLGNSFVESKKWTPLLFLTQLAMIKYWTGFSSLNLSSNTISWCLTSSRLYFTKSGNWYYYNGKVKREAIPYTYHNTLPDNIDLPIFDHKMLDSVVDFSLEGISLRQSEISKKLALLCWHLIEYKPKRKDSSMDDFIHAFETFYNKSLGNEWWNRLYHPLTLQNAFLFAASPNNNKKPTKINIRLYCDTSPSNEPIWPAFRSGKCRRVFKHHPNIPKTITDLIYLDDVQGIGVENWEETYLLVLSLPLKILLDKFKTTLENYCLLKLKKKEYPRQFLFPDFIISLGVLNEEGNISYNEITPKEADHLLINSNCVSCNVRF